MQRMRQWMASGLTPLRRRRSDAGRTVVVLGAGIVSLAVGAAIVVRPLRSGLRAVPSGLSRASGLFGRLISTTRRAVENGSSVVLPDEVAGDGVRPKAPEARSTTSDQPTTRV
jgi:hypothetical protein